MRANYVIGFVSDMKRALSLYRDVLGLPLRFYRVDYSHQRDWVREPGRSRITESGASGLRPISPGIDGLQIYGELVRWPQALPVPRR
jgi:hypothetical protein